jgi:ABC-2 type transport system permease protein
VGGGAGEVKGVKILAARLEGFDAKALRDAIDRLKQQLGDAVIVLAGVASGAALFPVGDVVLLSGQTIGPGEFAGRAALLVLYVTLSFSGLCAIGLFISTLTTIPVGAMAATVVLAGASQIADALPQLDAIHAYLPSHYWLGFGDLLRTPLVWDSFAQNGWLQLGYVVVFGGLAVWRFLTKDVLS